MDSVDKFRKKVSQIYELSSCAVHESAHTLYGLLHNIKIDSVEIFENHDTCRIEGLTYYQIPTLNENNTLEFVLAEICLKYAGLAAEKQHFKNISGLDKFPKFLKDGSSEDTLSAAALIRKFNLASPGKKRYLFKQNLILQTQRELNFHWDSLTLISHSLFQKKILSYNDLQLLLTKKSSNKKFWKDKFKEISNLYFKEEIFTLVD